MPKFYASNEDVQNAINRGKRISSAHWIYTESDADANYYAIIHDMEWIVAHLRKMLAINAVIHYAVTKSPAPFQVARTSENNFLLLIDCDAYYDILGLSYRIQTLPEFSEFLGLSSIPLSASHSGKYLLDIIKDFLRSPIDILQAIKTTKSLLAHQAALLFIIGHEVAHITHGHLDFIKSDTYKSFALDEQDENLTLRTLEMDADSSGTTNVSATMESLIPPLLDRQGIETEPDRETRSTLLRRQYTTGIYTALLYSDARMKNFCTPKHPMSYARFLTASGVLEAALKRDIGDEASTTPEQVREKLTESFAKISGSLGNLGHPIASNMMVFESGAANPDYQYNEFGMLIGLGELEPLHARWSRLRPVLEQHQLGGILAPAIEPPA